jgi:hypothetical protein
MHVCGSCPCDFTKLNSGSCIPVAAFIFISSCKQLSCHDKQLHAVCITPFKWCVESACYTLGHAVAALLLHGSHQHTSAVQPCVEVSLVIATRCTAVTT